MKSVAIIGATGMLGSMLVQILGKDHRLIMVYREKNDVRMLQKLAGKRARHQYVRADLYRSGRSKRAFKRILGILNADAVINAAAVLKIKTLQETEEISFINGTLPHLLAQHFGAKLIHISTDGVFDGTKGSPYDERATPNASDLYAITKRMGEPKGAITLRTSIIGPSPKGDGLLEWLKRQRGKIVNGHAGAYWNGITTKELSAICAKLIDGKIKVRPGIYHIFSTPGISKYKLLVKLKKKYHIPCTLVKDRRVKKDLRLSTRFSLNKKLKIPTIDKMIAEL